MRKSIIGIIVIIVIILVGAIVYGYQQSADSDAEILSNSNSNIQSGPHIVIEPATHDFGLVKFGDVPEYTFIVKNIGNQILEVNGVTTSCACTNGEIDNMSIVPGGQANLLVSFNPAIHGDDTDMGELTRTIYISTNDPNKEEVEAKIYAEVYK